MLKPRDLFAKPALPQTAGRIIVWWEARRLYYNAILLVAIIAVSMAAAVLPAADRQQHLSNAWGMFIYGFSLLLIPANFWYTGGWITDLLLKKVLRITAGGFAPWALGGGIVFSLLFMGLIYDLFFQAFLDGIRAP